MLLTVFTPTYNRADTITRLYESLKEQSFKDFEWLIVDDGSTDNTAEVVRQFTLKNEFPIRYILKGNGGKHTAYNIGLEEAEGILFFNVDSDDWLDKDSLLNISRLSEKVFSNEDCAGIIGLKSFGNGNIIGNKYYNDDCYLSLRDIELTGQGGERSIVFRTELAKKYKFPIVATEKFMPEGVVYDKFRNSLFYISNQILTICEYQPMGLSSNPKGLMIRNPGGYKLYYKHRLDIAENLKQLIGYILRYNYFSSIYHGNEIEDYRGRYSFLVKILKIGNPLVSLRYK